MVIIIMKGTVSFELRLLVNINLSSRLKLKAWSVCCRAYNKFDYFVFDWTGNKGVGLFITVI